LSRIEREAFFGTGLVEIICPASVEYLGVSCFSECRSLSSIRFKSRSKLSQIEMMAFFQTDLVEIILPASVEYLGSRCFSACRSLSSVIFESGSKWLRREREVLDQAGWFGSDE
jgi:hypothetical protein